MRDLRSLGPLLQMGWLVAFATLLPLGAGVWLDRRLGTAPLFILVGAIVGIVASTVGVLRIASRTIEALGRPPEGEVTSAEAGQAEAGEKEDRA